MRILAKTVLQTAAGILLGALSVPAAASDQQHAPIEIRDLVTIEGVRQNPLIGYGLVVGLAGTGDRRQTQFSTQTLGNVLTRLGVQIPAAAVSVKNVAAVFVTAALPPFARPGTQIDVTVSSTGDATSLEGGTLLLTALLGPDGQVYAEAQGPLTLGGYSAGHAGNSKQVNHPTAGRIPNGGLVERDTSVDLARLPRLSLVLRDADFRVTRDMADAINREAGHTMATAVDSRRVDLQNPGGNSVPDLLARVLSLRVQTHPRAKVVVNERTGTIVMGRDVRLTAVSILHGDLSIQVTTEYEVSQPNSFTNGRQATVVPQTNLEAKEQTARRIELGEGASVEQLVNGLQAIGATARDVVAILQAIKAAGALQADLEVI